MLTETKWAGLFESYQKRYPRAISLQEEHYVINPEREETVTNQANEVCDQVDSHK